MLLRLVRNLFTCLWNVLPLPSSWKIKGDETGSSDEKSNPTEAIHDGGLTREERKKQYLWLLRLMVALAIPVILETLDYTGEPALLLFWKIWFVIT